MRVLPKGERRKDKRWLTARGFHNAFAQEALIRFL